MTVEISPGKELLEMAIEIEKNGRGFYLSIADKTKEREVRDVFARLAAQEQEHENIFRDILNRLGGYKPPEAMKEHQKYIKSLADSSIFVGERADEVKNRKIRTDIEATEIGIGFEKDSILFYSEMRGMCPRQEQEIVDMVVSEEKKHLSELTYIRNKLISGAK